MLVSQLQDALKAKGFDPGGIDGVLGRGTIDAVRRFQAAQRLPATGVAGPEVVAALRGGDEAPEDNGVAPLAQPWMIEAAACLGITEDTSPKSNPLIIGWAKRLKINYGDDSIAWCGLFVAHCIGSQLTSEVLPSNALGARNWAKFGKPCKVPQPGAVMVFWRKTLASGLGHVAFYVGEDPNAYHVIGGNQSDKVSVTRMPRDRFIEARWPATAPAPTGKPRLVSPTGALSVREA